MVIAPYFNKPNQEQIYEHFRQVAESVSVNVILYNIPIFTGVNIEPETLARLARIGNVVAIKDEAELNPKQVTAYINATPAEHGRASYRERVGQYGEITVMTESLKKNKN